MAARGTGPEAASGVIRECAYAVDLLGLHHASPERYPFLLDSAAHGSDHGRYDILLAFPGESLTMDTDGRLSGPHSDAHGGFLEGLDNWFRASQAPAEGLDLPFQGGWFLFLGFELAGEIEPTLELRAEPGWPVARATRIPAAIVRDHVERRAWLVAEPGRQSLIAAMARDSACAPAAPTVSRQTIGELAEEHADQFIDAVKRAKEYIFEGDIFQANLSRAWRGALRDGITPAHLYARLRKTNPGPFAGLAHLDGRSIVSSSPERLVRVSAGGRVDTRPIAGTRPRDEPAYAMQARRDELLRHPKERAEHIMLIDLERNDLGRVCQPGTVRVDEYMAVESYSHVHHIVSNVTGELRPGVCPGEVISAVFPGGTITGCPKVRCIEVIRELEGRARGAYTGSMGYLNLDGSLDLNILIRTITCDGSDIRLDAGGGIVADSDPERELEETRAKARGVLAALGCER